MQSHSKDFFVEPEFVYNRSVVYHKMYRYIHNLICMYFTNVLCSTYALSLNATMNIFYNKMVDTVTVHF